MSPDRRDPGASRPPAAAPAPRPAAPPVGPPAGPPTGAALRAAARRAVALPEAALLLECDEDFFIASGPGGQHRNKTESGVRLAHRPTGVTVTATERRSQSQNRGAALERLRERLQGMGVEPRPRRPTKPTRGSKERRLGEKKHLAAKRAARKAFD